MRITRLLPWLLGMWLCVGRLFGAELPPIPAFEPDPVQLGYLKRSLALLQSASVSNQPTFKILVYGQSFSQGPWSELLVAKLQHQYPYVHFVLTNRAIAGMTTWFLSHAANADIGPWQPDLVLLNTLFDEPVDYERLYQSIRQSCTADIMVHADHPRSADQLTESLDPSVVTWESYIVLKNYYWLPEIANRYGICFADIRTPWKDYLNANGLPFNRVLGEDNNHFNEDGHRLQCELLQNYFLRRPIQPPVDPLNNDRVVTRKIGSELNWDGSSMTLKVFGNRVDVEYVDDPGANAPSYAVTLDGRAPDSFPDLYSFDRATPSFSIRTWPGILYVATAGPLQAETWTLRTLEMNDSSGEVRFSVTGSKTGFDGTGSSLEDFVSNSKRLVIPANMLMVYPAFSRTQWRPTPDWEIYVDAVPRFVNTFRPSAGPTAGARVVQTLFQSATDGERVVRIDCTQGQPKGLRSIRVHSPSGHAALTQVGSPVVPTGEFKVRWQNATLLLSWPTSWGVGRVQRSNTSNPGGTWTDVSGTPTTAGERYELTRSADGAVGFFRWAR